MDYHAQAASNWFNPYGDENLLLMSPTQSHTGANGNICLPDSFAVTLKGDAS